MPSYPWSSAKHKSVCADSLTMACQCCTLWGLHCCCSLLLSIQYYLGLLCQGAGGGGAVWSLLISLDSLCLVCVFLTLSLVAVTPPFSAGAISVHPISLAAVAIGKRRVVGHDWHCTVGTWCASKASLTWGFSSSVHQSADWFWCYF